MRISDWSSDVCSSDLGGAPDREVPIGVDLESVQPAPESAELELSGRNGPEVGGKRRKARHVDMFGADRIGRDLGGANGIILELPARQAPVLDHRVLYVVATIHELDEVAATRSGPEASLVGKRVF